NSPQRLCPYDAEHAFGLAADHTIHPILVEAPESGRRGVAKARAPVSVLQPEESASAVQLQILHELGCGRLQLPYKLSKREADRIIDLLLSERRAQLAGSGEGGKDVNGNEISISAS